MKYKGYKFNYQSDDVPYPRFEVMACHDVGYELRWYGDEGSTVTLVTEEVIDRWIERGSFILDEVSQVRQIISRYEM